MRARQLVGPVLVAAGVWCALGQLTPVSADGAATRRAVPAALLWLPIVFALALTLREWRRHPLSASPALLAVWPWLPIPTPPVALLWTGGLAWVPVGLAVLAGLGAGKRGQGTASAKAGGGTGRPVILAGLATLVMALATAWSLAPRLPGGDEPHYLIITQSLLADGDIRIANNHARRDYAAYFNGQLNPDKIQDGKNGEVYSIHAPGTSVLVLPAFAAFGYRGAQITVILLAGLTGALVWYGAWLGARDLRAAWVAWAAVSGSATFLFQSVTIFPDGPGAFVAAAAVAVAMRLVRGLPVSRLSLVGVGGLLAALPWLHTRFSLLAAGLGLLLAWLLWRETGTARERWARIALLLAIPVVSAAGWFAFFLVIYGTPDPSAPYGADPQTSLAYVPGGMVALLLDQQFGLLAYSPLLAAAFAGAAARRVSFGASAFIARACLGIAFAYFAAVGLYWMWWAGVPATPARFAAAALPLFSVPVALAWSRASEAGRALWRVLLVAGFVLTTIVLGSDRGTLAWNHRATARAAWIDWMGSAADVARGLPSFFWRLDPGHPVSEVGFALHAATTVVVAIGLAFAATRARVGAAAAASWWAAAVLMVAVQSGWWLNRVPPLEPSRAQLAALAGAAGGQEAVQIAPWSWRQTAPDAFPLRIRAPRVDVDASGDPLWGAFSSVPAGVYRMDIAASSPADGRVRVLVGRTEIAAFAAADRSHEVHLPGGAAALTVLVDDALRREVTGIQLVPLRLLAPVAAFARSVADFGGRRVDLLDDSAFVESDGFWVRGRSTAAFVVSSMAQTAVTLDLSNGPVANLVTVETDGSREVLDLGASESRAIPVTLDARGTARVRVSSTGGFRPSDLGDSRDSRYLGVRARVR